MKTNLRTLIIHAAAVLLPASAFAAVPIVNFDGDKRFVLPGEVLTIEATASDPIDGDAITDWNWELDQGPYGHDGILTDTNSPTQTFTATALGQYSVSVWVVDSQSEQSGRDHMLITVVEVIPPDAVITADVTQGLSPLTVTFDASGSTDPDGGPLQYEWDFGDGEAGVGEVVQHTYFGGSYVAKLYATNEVGVTGSESIRITSIGQHCPIVNAGDHQVTYPNGEITLHGNATDPDGGTIGFWSWEITQGPWAHDGYLYNRYSPNPEFTATVPGQYTLAVYVIDSQYQQSARDYILIDVVDNYPPQAWITKHADIFSYRVSGPAPLTMIFSAHRSRDPEGAALDYFWDFGDGGTGVGECVEHTFDAPGTYTVSLTVSDEVPFSATATVEVTVIGGGTPPVVDAGEDQVMRPGKLLELHATASNPVDGDTIGYYYGWTVIHGPAGHDAYLSVDTIGYFTATVPGDYLVAAFVIDENWECSAPDYVEIWVGAMAVDPRTHDFGDVPVGDSSTAIVTLTNLTEFTRSVTDLALSGDPVFAVDAPALPVEVPSGGSLEIEVSCTPAALGPMAGVLTIQCDDPLAPETMMALGAVGITAELPPTEQIAAIRAHVDLAVANGTLVGVGNGNSVGNKLKALRNQLDAADDLIQGGWYDQASGQLGAILKKCDGQPRPPDFVSGPAAAELAQMIVELMAMLDSE